MNRKEAAGVSKQKEVGMLKGLWKGKGVPIFIGAVMGALIVLMLMSAGTASASQDVQNWAELVYRSSPNVATAFVYAAIDSAVLRVMFGPQMRMAKSVKNEANGDSSDYMVKVNKGDTITVMIEAWNDMAASDSTAHHVLVYDTFALLPFITGGTTGCSVGPLANGNSFTYVASSETYTQGNSYTAPTQIAYYNYLTKRWEGDGGGDVVVNLNDPYDADWITYGAAREGSAPGGSTSNIVGIAWYWPQVFSRTASDGNTTPYEVKVQFQIKKNDN